MEIFRINIKPQAEIEKHDAFKKSHFNCPLCDSMMSFQTTRGSEPFQVVEDAHCSDCDVLVRSERFTEH